MDLEYWEEYYDKHDKPFQPSDFAKFVAEYIDRGDSLLDIGCGNGRDSVFFGTNGVATTAIDQSENAINSLKELEIENLFPIVGDFVEPASKFGTKHFYSRFTLHSIDEESETKVLNWVGDELTDGYFFVEVRSDEDSLVGKTTDHYRRFINFDDFIVKLIDIGFTINYAEIGRGFSKYNSDFNVDYNEDDPMLIRIVARKK